MRPDQPKKGLEQANKQISESTFAEPTKNAGHWETSADCAKKCLLWEIHEKPWDLGDLAKSTYNHLVTFDYRGT